MTGDLEGILSGLRVVEYADFVSGPYVGRQLAELGAEVIKVEPPGRGDTARRTGPFAHDIPALDTSLLFNFLNGNKLGVTLDISTPTGHELLSGLLREADVFLYGGAAAQVDVLGLDHHGLQKANPRLISTYLTPFGLSGPYRNFKGGELVLDHLAGLSYSTPGGLTDKTKPPLKPGGRHALMMAGLHGAAATLLALFLREGTQHGQAVDVSEIEPITSIQLFSVMQVAFTGQQGVRGSGEAAPFYEATDGTVTISPMQEHMWQAMVHVMGDPAWASEPAFVNRMARNANRKAVHDRVTEWTSTLPKDEIYQSLQASRVPAFPTNTVADVLASVQIQDRGFFEQIPLPSGEDATAPGPRYRFNEGLPGIRRPAPRLGEHTCQILRERLHVTGEDLVTLFELGII